MLCCRQHKIVHCRRQKWSIIRDYIALYSIDRSAQYVGTNVNNLKPTVTGNRPHSKRWTNVTFECFIYYTYVDQILYFTDSKPENRRFENYVHLKKSRRPVPPPVEYVQLPNLQEEVRIETENTSAFKDQQPTRGYLWIIWCPTIVWTTRHWNSEIIWHYCKTSCTVACILVCIHVPIHSCIHVLNKCIYVFLHVALHIHVFRAG